MKRKSYKPSRAGRKRTDRESKALKAEIIKLRRRRKSTVQIGKELGVTRQYVSAVLKEAGQGIREEQRAKKQARTEAQTRSKKEAVEKSISQMEQRGEYTMAGLLRAVAERRKASGR